MCNYVLLISPVWLISGHNGHKLIASRNSIFRCVRIFTTNTCCLIGWLLSHQHILHNVLKMVLWHFSIHVWIHNVYTLTCWRWWWWKCWSWWLSILLMLHYKMMNINENKKVFFMIAWLYVRKNVILCF